MYSFLCIKDFKRAVKSHTSKEPLDLDWDLIKNPKDVKVIQTRVHTVNLSKLRVIDKWFQITCKFTNEEGKEMINIMEKYEKGKIFKFVKFDI